MLGCVCTFGDGKCRRPLRPKNVQTDAAIAVDIWVVDSCGERNLRGTKEKQNKMHTHQFNIKKKKQIYSHDTIHNLSPIV